MMIDLLEGNYASDAEYDVILRLFSIMCLNFVAELILRLRGND